MNKYAGQQLTTGTQAQTYADHFIANHLKTIGGITAGTVVVGSSGNAVAGDSG